MNDKWFTQYPNFGDNSNYVSSTLNTKEPTANTTMYNPTNYSNPNLQRIKKKISLQNSGNYKMSLRKKTLNQGVLNTSIASTPKTLSTLKSKKENNFQFSKNHKKLPSKPFYLINAELQQKINLYYKETLKHKTPKLSHLIKTPKNNYLKTMEYASILIKPNPEKSTLLQRLLKTETNIIFAELKQTIRWLSIFKLWKDYLLLLDKIFVYYKEFKFYLENDHELTKKNFYDYLHMINTKNLYTNKKNVVFEFCDDVYTIFGEDKTNYEILEIKEFLHCMIVTNQTMSYDEKIGILIEIWARYQNETSTFDYIYFREMCRLIKINLFVQKDYEKINFLLKVLYNGKESMNKEEVKKYFLTNEKLKKIMLRSLFIDVKLLEDYFNEEIMKIFHSNLANSRSLIDGRTIQITCLNGVTRLEQNMKSLVYLQEEKKRLKNLKSLFSHRNQKKNKINKFSSVYI